MAQYDIDLRDYWRVINKRKSIIIFSSITLLIFSFIFANFRKSRTSHIYSSSASIRIDRMIQADEMALVSYGYMNTDDVATDVKTITSFPVMAEVAVRCGILPDSLRNKPEDVRNQIIQSNPDFTSAVNGLGNDVRPERFEYTNIVTVNTFSNDPTRARDLAQSVVEAYKDLRKKSVNLRIINTIKFIEEKTKNVEAEIDSTQLILNAYSSKYNSRMPFVENTDIAAGIADISRRRNELDLKKNSTELMMSILDKDGVINDSALSGTFTEGEGQIFREKYSELLRLYAQRDDLTSYFTNEHPEVKMVNAKIENTKKQLLQELKNKITTLDMQRKSYDIALDGLMANYKTATTMGDSLKRIEDKRRILQERYYEYQKQLQLVQIKKSEDIDEVTIIKPAVINPKPINATASVAATSFIGMFLGMVIGLIAAFVFETLDTSIATIEDVEKYLGVSVIGLIPYIESEELKGDLGSYQRDKEQERDIPKDHFRLVIKYAPKSVLAESYRSLRTNIQFIVLEKKAKVLLFTSSSPREGKTTTIVNLALTMAQSGNRVLLIDADLRKPKIHHVFGLEKERGLGDIIINKRQWQETVKSITDIVTGELGMDDLILTPGIDNLNIITCGATAPNPSELLNSESMDKFIAEVREQYDMVLFDCPPTLPATDSTVLGRKVDGVVLVYAVGKISRGALKRTKAQMDNVKAQVVGIVLNGVRSELSSDFHDYKYKQYYYYAYGKEEGEEQEPQNAVEKIKKKVENLINRFI